MRIGLSLPSAFIDGLVVGALVADLPFVTPRARAQFCNAILRQIRSSQPRTEMLLHLATQNGTVLLEMAVQVTGVGSERCVILIGREVNSGLAGLVVDQSAAAALESAPDGNGVVIEETASESAPSKASVDLAGSSDDLLVTSSSDDLPIMSTISDTTLPTTFRSSDITLPTTFRFNSSGCDISDTPPAVSSREVSSSEVEATSTSNPNAFEAASLSSLPTFNGESIAADRGPMERCVLH